MSSSSSNAAARFFVGVRYDQQSKYELMHQLGRGAYGEVWSAKAQPENAEQELKLADSRVAIKKIQNCFCQATEAKRILRELRILRHLSHPNVIKIRDVLRPQSEGSFSDLWVVFDFVDLDLRKLIASPQSISVAHVQWIAHQMLVGLKYLHSAHVLHRDLKPANVLLSERCDVKLCDFGLARVVEEEDWALNEQRLHAGPALIRQTSSGYIRPPAMTRQMTSHVVTRWYRAPELILLQRYTTAIDVWSFACIFAELLTMLPEASLDRRERCALFPGRSCLPLSPLDEELGSSPNLDQLNVIFSVIGTPTGPLGWIDLKEMREHVASLSPVPRQPLQELCPAAPPSAIALLDCILRFDPSRRCSLDDALAHPFFDGMQRRASMQLAAQPVDVATIDFEKAELRVPAIRRLIVQEIQHYATRAEAASAATDMDAPRAAAVSAKRKLPDGQGGGGEVLSKAAKRAAAEASSSTPATAKVDGADGSERAAADGVRAAAA
uniref:Mitogen-activated protein kinase n=1 Tax=Calcidiscus leptoporus TaxID=127549 RepID=A0A7S0JJQ2_9EUKA|mmetsp:Transcript_7085/g.16572  ORF Transcript_7085/g.16572 Transcript_7085/m.16572 type:complete len:496 (+) Transcript_7085:146-1633(+)